MNATGDPHGPPHAGGPTHPSAPRILVVEDDENLRLALTDNLADEGYFVEAVSGAAAALRALLLLVSALALALVVVLAME